MNCDNCCLVKIEEYSSEIDVIFKERKHVHLKKRNAVEMCVS